jgi:thioredoxin reductase
MPPEETFFCDVAIIGGGPAGISAALELSRLDNLKIELFENETQLGGIPLSAHYFFGMRDIKRISSGKKYTDILNSRIKKTPINIHTNSTVVALNPEVKNGTHEIIVASEKGYRKYHCKFILLATGCYEASREKRLIPGSRPAGIYTTGTLQKMVNLQKLKPGNSAVVVGSEHVAFSSVLSLKQAGIKIKGIIESDHEIHSYPFVGSFMGFLYSFPIYRNTEILEILGSKRVTGIYLENRTDGKKFKIDCDTVIITGKFTPESALLDDTGIELDDLTCGPAIDMNYQTSISNIYAAGNVLRGANTHDRCALEGRRAGKIIADAITQGPKKNGGFMYLKASPPITYVVPQKLIPSEAKKYRTSFFTPCVGIQTSKTMRNPVIKAYSGKEEIWGKRLSRIIGNTNIPIQIEKFKWDRIDLKKGVELKITN